MPRGEKRDILTKRRTGVEMMQGNGRKQRCVGRSQIEARKKEREEEKGNRQDKSSRFSLGTPTGSTCFSILMQALFCMFFFFSVICTFPGKPYHKNAWPPWCSTGLQLIRPC